MPRLSRSRKTFRSRPKAVPLRRSRSIRPAAIRSTARLSRLRRPPRPEVKEIRGSYDLILGAAGGTSWDAQGVQPCLMGPNSVNFNTVQPGQGLGQGERIGNRVRIKKVTMRAVMYPQPYDVAFNPAPKPLYVIIWFFKQKISLLEADSQAQATTRCLSDFFNDGSFATGMTGTLVDFTLPINRDTVDVKRCLKFKLGCARFEGTGYAVANHYQNNDFKYSQSFTMDLTKYAKKAMVWNDVGAGGPRGQRQLWMCASVVNADGTTLADSDQSARMRYNLEFKYTDA